MPNHYILIFTNNYYLKQIVIYTYHYLRFELILEFQLQKLICIYQSRDQI
jgi:hypothetical protein